MVATPATTLALLRGQSIAALREGRGLTQPVLDRAKAVLDEYPEVKVEISGHTDTDGDRDHNIDLSRRRAEAVRRYLVDAGIDESRITTRGAGPDEPLGSNDTEAGKAKNRRIEFNLIQ